MLFFVPAACMPCLSKICPDWTNGQIAENWPQNAELLIGNSFSDVNFLFSSPILWKFYEDIRGSSFMAVFFKQKCEFYENAYFCIGKLILKILSLAS